MSDKVSKESVNYRGSVLDTKHCSNCSMFRPNAAGIWKSGTSFGLCTLVQGSISPHAICDKWEKIT